MTAHALEVTRLAADDATEYRRLMLDAYEHEADAFTSTAEERAAEPLAWWEKRIADPEGLRLALGVRDEGRLIGTVALEFSAKPKTRHKVLLIGMYVAPSARKTGAGRALVHAALSFARARPGVTVIGLTVTEGNAPAIGLYEACGFQVFGTEPMAMLTASGYRAKVHMWRAV
jgi:RimJ/RimL family protein N-acetyltransferase